MSVSKKKELNLARLKLDGYFSLCYVCFEQVREYDFVNHKCSSISDNLEKLLDRICFKINSYVFTDNKEPLQISRVLLNYLDQFKNLSQEILTDKEVMSLYNKILSEMNWSHPKTQTWFKTENPLLGGMSPDEMIKKGRIEKLKQFIEVALDENKREE